jgi:hypothetical protein
LSNGAILSKIDSYTALLSVSAATKNNFIRWPVLGTYIWPNNFVGNTSEQELGYLIDWIENRLLWMDTEIGGL